MKKYKVRLVGMGIEAVAIIPFDSEPTIEKLENNVAYYLNNNLMKVEYDGNFSTPEQDQENGESRFVVTKVDGGSLFYVIWDYTSKSILEYSEG